jgi:hypothetical protein
VFNLGVINGLLYDMVGSLLHERNLVKGSPNEISYGFLDIFFSIPVKYPGKITLPSDDP